MRMTNWCGRKRDIEEFPALDPIPVYPVRVDPVTNEIKVKISSDKISSSTNASHGVIKPLSKFAEGNNETVLIIGSGLQIFLHYFF